MIRKAIITASTIVATSTGLLWAASYVVSVRLWAFPTSSGFTVFDAEHGCGNVIYGDAWDSQALEIWKMTYREYEDALEDFAGWTNRTEFRIITSHWYMADFRWTAVSFPLSPVWILFSVYPTIAFIRGPLRRHRRRKRGQCLTCGYNLTGNISGVCPECGTKIDSPAK